MKWLRRIDRRLRPSRYWTQAEIDRIEERARELRKFLDPCPGQAARAFADTTDEPAPSEDPNPRAE